MSCSVQLGLQKDSSEALVLHYSDVKQDIQQTLEKNSFRKSVLNDVKWRVDHVIACSDESQKSEVGTQVQLILNIDSNPHLSDEPKNEDAKNDVLAVEMTGEKFEVLYQEVRVDEDINYFMSVRTDDIL